MRRFLVSSDEHLMKSRCCTSNVLARKWVDGWTLASILLWKWHTYQTATWRALKGCSSSSISIGLNANVEEQHPTSFTVYRQSNFVQWFNVLCSEIFPHFLPLTSIYWLLPLTMPRCECAINVMNNAKPHENETEYYTPHRMHEKPLKYIDFVRRISFCAAIKCECMAF